MEWRIDKIHSGIIITDVDGYRYGIFEDTHGGFVSYVIGDVGAIGYITSSNKVNPFGLSYPPACNTIDEAKARCERHCKLRVLT